MILQMSKQNFNIYKQLLINTLIQFIMKKIFFLAASAILLAAGCQKTEVLNQVNPVGEPSMTFAPEMGKLTKAASEAGLATLKAQDFRLWAYYAANDANRGASENDVYDGMYNISVSDNTEGVWETAIAHFWPGAGKELKFFAVSADEATLGAEKSDTKVSVVPATKTLTITDFVVDADTPDTDLMIADYEQADQDKYKDDVTAAKTAKLKFRHSLAKVEFLFKNEMAETDTENKVIVQHMYVDGIATTGTVSVTEQTEKLTFDAWTDTGVPARFNGDFKAETPVVLPSYSDAENKTQYTGEVGSENYTEVPTGFEMELTTGFQTYTTWLVIPQSVGTAADASLNVVIAYLIGNRQFVATFPLYRANVDKWHPNQYIKYNVSLSPNIIGFTPSVEEWTEDPNGGVAINQ